MSGPQRSRDGTPSTRSAGSASQRLDKWLWCARLARTRTQAASLVISGKIRVNRLKVVKPAHLVRIDDVVTASVGPRVRVLRILSFCERRGGANLAATLFEDLMSGVETAGVELNLAGPGSGAASSQFAKREAGAGRPTKRDRRMIDRLKREL